MRLIILVGLMAMAIGCEGPAGAPGQPGAMGEMGLMGAMGLPGMDGQNGDAGPPGPMGEMGLPGTAAQKGDPGDTGPAGATGPAGPQGQQGAKGDKGDKGDPGLDGGKIVRSIHCDGVLEGQTIATRYNAYIFSNNVIFVSGNIRSLELQASESDFWVPTQVDWAIAPIRISFDLSGADNGGYWRLSLNRTTLVVTIEYFDNDNVTNPRVWSWTPSQCTINTYP